MPIHVRYKNFLIEVGSDNKELTHTPQYYTLVVHIIKKIV
jgi:hypothetical protein